MVNNTRTMEKIVNIAIRLPAAIFQPALTCLSVYIHWHFRVRGEKSIGPNTNLPSQHYVTRTMFTASYGLIRRSIFFIQPNQSTYSRSSGSFMFILRLEEATTAGNV